ncbi:PREDICTED: C-C motif chemokine 22 [Condylura cristata]|uniref:C-C motif chemokine 22 n=1 Tax=Condylura cristata TaxID=143302 RepID=UPI000334360C|nr:PREDICTED: C-C motif chemokine 22 [Condylura cristata]
MANLPSLGLAALVLLVMVLQATEAGPYGANVEDSICCRDYMRRPLPLRVVKDVYWTSGSCQRPGVVLVTFKKLEVCADPKHLWVKRILQKLDK